MLIAYTFFGSARDRRPDPVRSSACPTASRCSPTGYRFSWATALVITFALAALVRPLIYLLVFRPLRSTRPRWPEVVSSLGLFLYLLAIADSRSRRRRAPRRRGPSTCSATTWCTVLGVAVPQDRLWLLAIVVAVTLALVVVFRSTRFGLATRAAAETEKGAVLLGFSPDRLAAVNWMLSTVLAGGAVILFAPIAGHEPEHHQPARRARAGRRARRRLQVLRPHGRAPASRSA